MRGVVFTGERGLELMQFPDPTPETHDVVIEMKASGMCGSDLHQYRRPKGQSQATGIPVSEGPVIVGHEPCGVVVEAGSAVDAKMVTRFGPLTIPWMVCFVWVLTTLIESPSAPASSALPRVVSRMPGTS